jgi:hypothetical protein
LNEKHYRENAKRIAAEMQAMPRLEQGIRPLETLVAEHHLVGAD